MYLDARFWSSFFRESFAEQIHTFCEVFEERVLHVFSNAETEAEEAAEREYQRLGSLPSGEYGPEIEMEEAAESAQEAGLAHYEMLIAANQTFLNLAAAALYHMFEQQLLVFHRRQVLQPSEEYDQKLSTDLGAFFKKLVAGGITVNALPAWAIVEELKLAANTIKHGEGQSARRLRDVCPRLFTPPTLHGTQWETTYFHGTVSQPLAGTDIFVTTDDLRRYRYALTAFWAEFGEAILENQLRSSSS